MGLELTTDSYPPITSQTARLRHCGLTLTTNTIFTAANLLHGALIHG